MIDPATGLADALRVVHGVVARFADRGDGPAELEVLRSWTALLASTSKAAADVGVSERQVRLAEQQLDLMATAIDTVVRALGHDPAAPATRLVIEGAIRQLDVGEAA